MGLPFAIFRSPYLLDNAPAAFVAFSTRKLSSKATYALKVRRSSDNTEQDIGFKGAHLDTVALLAFCGVGDGFISKWYDQSGNGRDVVQTTAVNQPKIVSSGALTSTVNGKPAINFNGSQTLATVSSVTMSVAVSTYYVAARDWSAANYCSIISCSYNSGGGYACVASTGGTTFDWTTSQTMHVGNGFSTAQSPKALATFTPITANTYHLFDSTIGANASNVYKDGSVITTTSYTAAMPSITDILAVGQDIGFSDNYIGNLCEVINWLLYHPPSLQKMIRNDVNSYFSLY